MGGIRSGDKNYSNKQVTLAHQMGLGNEQGKENDENLGQMQMNKSRRYGENRQWLTSWLVKTRKQYSSSATWWKTSPSGS